MGALLCNIEKEKKKEKRKKGAPAGFLKVEARDARLDLVLAHLAARGPRSDHVDDDEAAS